MAKTKKYKQYNGQNKEIQTIQWPKQSLAIVLFVLLCFGHCIVCSSLFWPLYCLFFIDLAVVLSVLNGQNKEEQTIQWPKQRSTNNTMAKTKKYRQYNGENIALAIVLFVLLCFGHCIVCTSLLWPLYCLFFYTMAKTKKNRQYNGQNKEVQTIQWPKQRSTNNTMVKTKKYKQYNGQNKEAQTMYFFVLAIVLFVLLCFGHCIVCTSLFWPLYCQNKEVQTIQ
jgi:formate/nitrite transporter FocA (FNT family)